MTLGAMVEGIVFGARMTKFGKFNSSLLLLRCISSRSVQHQQVATSVEEKGRTTVAPRPTHEIPGPKSFPLVGSFPAFTYKYGLDTKAYHKAWSKVTEDYGPIVKLNLPGIGPFVALTNPDDCELVMRSTMENPVRFGFLSLKTIRMETEDNYFENKTGILTENGEEWWRVRSRVQTPMMKPKIVNEYLTQMDQVTLDFMDRIAALQEEFGEMPSNFQFELYKWALESVSLVALNRRLGCLDPNVSPDSDSMKMINIVNELFRLLNDVEGKPPIWKIFQTSSFRQLKKTHQEFLEIADSNIRQTEAALVNKKAGDSEELSLMETLFLIPGLSYKDVVTLILDMLFAGIDTTSHTVGFTLYLLARNPEVQARLQEEVDGVLGDLQGPVTPKHLAQLSYLKAVIKESLRIFPLTLGTARKLDRDLVLSGYVVPKGWTGMSVNMLMGWDESLFPRAKEFLPERWLRHKPLGPIHPYSSLPFSTGTRMCIGRRIAEQELYTFMARVMHRFTVDYKYEDMDIVTKFVFVPSEPLRFTFTERQ